MPTGANTQQALAGYLSDPARAAAAPAGLFVLTMAGTNIHAITRFHLDELYPRFGLAGSLPEPAQTAPPPALTASHRRTAAPVQLAQEMAGGGDGGGQAPGRLGIAGRDGCQASPVIWGA